MDVQADDAQNGRPVLDESCPASRLIDLAAAAADELPPLVARLQPAAGLQAYRAAGELNASMIALARQLAGACRDARGSIGGLAAELAAQANLLAMHLTIEAALAGGAALPHCGSEDCAERAVRDLTHGIAAIRTRLRPAA